MNYIENSIINIKKKKTKTLNFSFSYDHIFFDQLIDFKSKIEEIFELCTCNIYIKSLSFASLLEMNYFETLIYILAKKKCKVNILLTKDEYNKVTYYSIDCLINQSNSKKKVDFLTGKYNMKISIKNNGYIEEFTKQTSIFNEEGMGFRFFAIDNNCDINNIDLTLQSIFPDIYEDLFILLSELLNNTEEHDKHKTCVILHIDKKPYEKLDIYQISFMNFSGNIINEEIKKIISEETHELNYLLNGEDDEALLALILLVRTISTRDKKIINDFGGTGLAILNEEIKRKSLVGTYSYNNYMIFGKNRIDLSKFNVYNNLKVFEESFNKEKENYKKLRNDHIRGVMFNFYLVKENYEKRITDTR